MGYRLEVDFSCFSFVIRSYPGGYGIDRSGSTSLFVSFLFWGRWWFLVKVSPPGRGGCTLSCRGGRDESEVILYDLEKSQYPVWENQERFLGREWITSSWIMSGLQYKHSKWENSYDLTGPGLFLPLSVTFNWIVQVSLSERILRFFSKSEIQVYHTSLPCIGQFFSRKPSLCYPFPKLVVHFHVSSLCLIPRSLPDSRVSPPSLPPLVHTPFLSESSGLWIQDQYREGSLDRILKLE